MSWKQLLKRKNECDVLRKGVCTVHLICLHGNKYSSCYTELNDAESGASMCRLNITRCQLQPQHKPHPQNKCEYSSLWDCISRNTTMNLLNLLYIQLLQVNDFYFSVSAKENGGILQKVQFGAAAFNGFVLQPKPGDAL